MVRKWMYIAGGIVVLLLLIALLLPVFVNVNSYRPKIESMLATSLNRKVSIGNIGLSILSGGVSVADVAISDDPAFSPGNFLTAQSISVGVHLLPLIFSRSLEVTGITIEKPVINLVRSASGTWNFSTLGAGPASAGAPAAATPPASSGSSDGATSISVEKLTIRDGKLSVTDADTAGNAREYDQLEVEVSDLAASGFVDAASGIAGHLDFTGSLSGDGKQILSKGNVTASKLQLVPGSAPATQPVKLDYDASLQMQSQTGALSQCDVHIGKAVAHLAGTFNAAGKTPTLEMRLDGEAMPLSDLQAVLPAVNVALPAGTSLSAGTMNLNLAIAGPTDRLVISGPVSLSDATLAGYDMGSKLGVLGPFAGVKKSPNTVIQTFRSDLRVAGGATNADKIDLVVDGIGAITGNGTVGADQSLNFKMAAQLSGGALGGITKVASVGNKSGIPFSIHGTTSNPEFLPDVGGAAAGAVTGLGNTALGGGKGAASGVQNLGGSVGGLFGKKKQ